MRNKILLIAMSMVLAFSFVLGACANSKVPDGYLTLNIDKKSTGDKLIMVGAESDPFFLSENASRDYTGLGYEAKAEDWENIFEPRIAEMGIQFLRIMLLPSWYALEEESYTNKTYTWDSLHMRSLYQVLDTAQKYNIDINLTMWLWDANYYRLDESLGEEWAEGDWTLTTRGKGDTVFAEVYADAIDYLINERGYTCIKQITPINEPNSTYGFSYTTVQAIDAYVDLCKEIDRVFKERNLRDKVLFNLSDDARSYAWLSGTLDGLDGVYDIVNSHTYDFDESYTNSQMRTEDTYALGKYSKLSREYKVPHVFSEFGTNTYTGPSNWKESRRGTQIARIALNMLHSGSVGFSYWMLYSQYYFAESYEPTGEMRSVMGLWGAADEGYECRPVFYAYSLLTKYAKQGSEIYLIKDANDDLTAVALKKDNDWTYLVVNNSSTESYNIAFVNQGKYPKKLNKYVYDQNNVPTDNKVISSSGEVVADGRVVTDTVKPLTFTVFSTL